MTHIKILKFVLRSRCKKARPQDIAKGVSVLNGLCYPEMKRFIDIPQDRGNYKYCLSYVKYDKNCSHLGNLIML